MDIILKLEPNNEQANFSDISLKIANNEDVNFNDFKVSDMSSIGFYAYLKEIREYILEHGITSLMTIESVNEDFIPKGMPTDIIIVILQKYLDKLGIDNELIIIDPYFFASNKDADAYIQTVFETLKNYLPTINNLVIITNNKVNSTLKTAIENKLKKSKATLSIIHKINENYHDRFWISNNREKGIITGTSLNGLGRKFSLIDRLNIRDVREIIASLTTEGLL